MGRGRGRGRGSDDNRRRRRVIVINLREGQSTVIRCGRRIFIVRCR